MIGIVLQKEFRQIFRNPAILRLLLVMPIMQLIIIPFAADYEIKHINLAVNDLDHSHYSQRLIQKMVAGNYFTLVSASQRFSDALENVEDGKVDIILSIPAGFEKNLIRENMASLQLSTDAVNGQKAGLANIYAANIINDFNREVRDEWIQMPRHNAFPVINTISTLRYNPHNNYKLFMVPGILALLVTMVGALMSSLNIVSEKEKGTIEQINVTPLKKYQFLIGKLLPFWILGLISITLGFAVSYIVFGIWPVGSFFTIYFYTMIYLFTVLGIGLLLSTFVDTQQQATLFSFFIMMMFVLLGGLYTPVESMPLWAQKLSWFVPTSHFIQVIRSVVIKGSGFMDLKYEYITMAGFALAINTMAVLNYRKRA